jgi:hypothetical protein
MDTGNDIGNGLAHRCNNSDTELSKAHVNSVVKDGGKCISNEWSEKYQRNNSVIKIVVSFKLG